jgi:hypothetical protein
VRLSAISSVEVILDGEDIELSKLSEMVVDL